MANFLKARIFEIFEHDIFLDKGNFLVQYDGKGYIRTLSVVWDEDFCLDSLRRLKTVWDIITTQLYLTTKGLYVCLGRAKKKLTYFPIFGREWNSILMTSDCGFARVKGRIPLRDILVGILIASPRRAKSDHYVILKYYKVLTSLALWKIYVAIRAVSVWPKKVG